MESQIRQAIQDVLSGLGITDVDFAVEHPADLSHGDYATNVAMVVFSKPVKGNREFMEDVAKRKVDRIEHTKIYSAYVGGELVSNPHQLALKIAKMLAGKIPHISSIDIAGPGFINFHLDRNFFSEKIAEILANPEAWGKNDSLKGEEILFEYTSPNLFKPLHIGNLVGNIIGESISRIFEWSGARVHRINYPSDIGLTVAKGVWGLQSTGGDPKDINAIGEAYRIGNHAYEEGGAQKEEIEAINRALYAGNDASLNALRKVGIETSRARLAELCRMLGTTFDTEIFESMASEPGTTIVRENIGRVFEESDGAIVYRGEKVGLHTRVFLNSQGLPTYEAKDLGNFSLKQKQYPEWTQSFVVTGGEQREYFKVLIAALREVFPDAAEKVIEHIPTGFLTLTTGKMSSRKGNVLTGESLLAEVTEEAREKAAESRAEDLDMLTEMVAVSAVKYQILRQSIGSNIVFDKERALSFEGDSGPYLQYTHARIGSVATKASEVGIVPSTETVPGAVYPIEKLIYQFSEIVRKSEIDRAPHHLVVYLTELAGAFNTFYAHEKIADTTDSSAPYKLAIAYVVRATLKNGLYLLGIKAPERM